MNNFLQSVKQTGGVKSSLSFAKQLQPAVSITTEVCDYSIYEFSLIIIPQLCILYNSTHAKLGWSQWDRTQLKPRTYLNIIAGRFSFCLCLCFTNLTHFSQIEKFNEQLFAVRQTNWRGEELYVIRQAAPAGCQHHNRGMWLFYLWIQFNFVFSTAQLMQNWADLSEIEHNWNRELVWTL